MPTLPIAHSPGPPSYCRLPNFGQFSATSICVLLHTLVLFGRLMICPSCCHNNLPGDEVCRHCKQSLASFDLPQPENEVERSVMHDQVKSLKQNPAVIIGQTATISEAIAVMVETNVGALLIVDGRGQLTGIFSE